MTNLADRSPGRASRSFAFALVLVGLTGACAARQTGASVPATPPPAAPPPAAAEPPPAPVEAPPPPAAESAPAADTLIVDHAWVADVAGSNATAKKKNAAQRKSMEELRARVLAGQALPEAFKTLPGLENGGAAWHVGDHEEYPYNVVPPEAHDLPAGGVSAVLPGDGGIHLFKIHGRKKPAP
jgi:hypothetical protein